MHAPSVNGSSAAPPTQVRVSSRRTPARPSRRHAHSEYGSTIAGAVAAPGV
ncbi:hypothetical protein ACFQ0O_04490 [Saccharopolyspora spinosporotrichia]